MRGAPVFFRIYFSVYVVTIGFESKKIQLNVYIWEPIVENVRKA